MVSSAHTFVVYLAWIVFMGIKYKNKVGVSEQRALKTKLHYTSICKKKYFKHLPLKHVLPCVYHTKYKCIKKLSNVNKN